METKLLYILFFSVGITFSQNVNIPDNNFKAELIANTSINTNNDGEIQLSEASSFTGSISVINKNIDDLTGIEAFGRLKVLNCSNNYLKNIDLSANTSLISLKCGQNSLTSLDISNNTNLTYLLCYDNNLESLDITSNTSLRMLNCSNNKLTALNLANGNNTIIDNMNAIQNTNLSCIQIDAGFVPPRRNWQKDREAEYSKDCLIINKSSNSNKAISKSVHDKVFKDSIKIYPNPVANQLHILTNNAILKEIEVYDVLGNKVISTEKVVLNVSRLPKGVYFLIMKSENDLIATKKFVKK